jgi:hypothetical protein
MIWIAWVHADEAYLACRMFGKYQKASFHSSGVAQWSMTDEWVKEDSRRLNHERHVARWRFQEAVPGQATLLFKVQVPYSELRPIAAPKDNKKVFWVTAVPPEATVRFLFYLTGLAEMEPAPQATDSRRKLFALRLRSGRWLVVLVDLISLSAEDVSAARTALIEQFWPRASTTELSELRAVLFGPPAKDATDCHGAIEICLAEA